MAKKTPTFSTAIQPLLKLITNKYLIVLVAAGVWMLFFDRYNWNAQQKMDQRIAELQNNFEFYNNAIQSLDYQRDLIYNDLEEMERFAREKHLMKKPGEDIYLSVNE
ncbi:MAG: septum formation initiator family protein [Bacteroidota bacterium]